MNTANFHCSIIDEGKLTVRRCEEVTQRWTLSTGEHQQMRYGDLCLSINEQTIELEVRNCNIEDERQLWTIHVLDNTDQL